jgi:hypothetical protein
MLAMEPLEWRLLAPLKYSDEHQKCLLIGIDRKELPDGQSDAIDLERTFNRLDSRKIRRFIRCNWSIGPCLIRVIYLGWPHNPKSRPIKLKC